MKMQLGTHLLPLNYLKMQKRLLKSINNNLNNNKIIKKTIQVNY